jgi:hypothetical protein
MNRSNRGLDQLGSGLVGKWAEREPLRLAGAERRRNRERAVDKVRPGRDELDGDPIFGQSSERERGLETSDAGSCDQHFLPRIHFVDGGRPGSS